MKGAPNLPGSSGLLISGSWTLLRWQAEAAAWVIAYTAVATFIILKVIGIFIPLRMTDEELEIGDHAIHGNEVYPADVPTLGGPHRRRLGSPPRRLRAARAGGLWALGASIPADASRAGNGGQRPRFGGVAPCSRSVGVGRRPAWGGRCVAAPRRQIGGDRARWQACGAEARPTGQLTPVPPSPQ